MTDSYSMPVFPEPEFRWKRAREKFFGDHQRPTGMVRDTVIQSWERCLGNGRSTEESVTPPVVPDNELKNALRRSRRLIEAAAPELDKLELALAGTGCCVSLLNSVGVIVRSSPEQMTTGHVIRQLARLGVDMSEGAIGTSAPGIAMKTGHAALVEGGEHFFNGQGSMRCAAAPICDAQGNLAGVLNLAIEFHPFGFDPGAIVGMYAGVIENRLLKAQPMDNLLLEFQIAPALIGTGLEGLAGIRPDGTVAWLNGVGAQLVAPQQTRQLSVESAFGLTMADLRSHCSERGRIETAHRLPNGLLVFFVVSDCSRAEQSGAVNDSRESPLNGTEIPSIVSSLPQSSSDRLAAKERSLILEALQASNGNVSCAARRLGISRGRIYRALRGTAR
ncbi:helix-turn-helix domain-containing protein [Paraburkholderia sp. J7]|uniref:helix-turn-helix domain-containing protein n=1 Tax=Paraburkholderia sp. J7 TaxID=2805438 RepID=UPI002AB7C5B7|nr:helix-turn-helix domain-containing protein [Paraburkholderia sp. J7]